MTILWPPFVGWMFLCSLLFRILSRTRVIREIRGIRVFFSLPQIQALGKFVGTLIIGALGALRALRALGVI